LGIALEQTAAIGDGGNDPAMFHCAGLSIAMGQAEEAVKRQADVVTAPQHRRRRGPSDRKIHPATLNTYKTQCGSELARENGMSFNESVV
jgi:hypothetical protein